MSENISRFELEIEEFERLTAYNDTDLQVAFNSMIAAGMSYTEAMNLMNTVTAMAFSLNRDLGSMAQLVGKAYNGQTGELSRYGIVLEEGLETSEKFAALQKHVADNFADASARSKTLQGQIDTLDHQVQNVARVIYTELKFYKLCQIIDKILEYAILKLNKRRHKK
jgi:hypothetical protein